MNPGHPAGRGKDGGSSSAGSDWPEWLRVTARQVASMDYGQVTLTIHQGEVIEVQKTERMRFASARKKS